MSKVELRMNEKGEIISTDISNDPYNTLGKALESGDFKVWDGQNLQELKEFSDSIPKN